MAVRPWWPEFAEPEERPCRCPASLVSQRNAGLCLHRDELCRPPAMGKKPIRSPKAIHQSGICNYDTASIIPVGKFGPSNPNPRCVWASGSFCLELDQSCNVRFASVTIP
uniref:Uncharacterized protein n=1 Tax=Oryza meridionalis TaxID=40149 RepID=A0A0E0CR82_9ORYZ